MAISNRDHSIIACSRHVYMGVVLRTHPFRGESHIQRNTNGEVTTTPFLGKELTGNNRREASQRLEISLGIGTPRHRHIGVKRNF